MTHPHPLDIPLGSWIISEKVTFPAADNNPTPDVNLTVLHIARCTCAISPLTAQKVDTRQP